MNVFEKILERLEKVENRLLNESGDIGCTLGITNMYEYSKQIVQEVAEEFGPDTNVGTNGWIPCSVRLPKEDGSYLVQSVFEEKVHFYDQYYDSGCEAFGTYMDYYDKNTLGFLDSEFVKDEYVVAWQPLPEPYKESEE